MFSQLLFTRVRAAEQALRHNRLEEAFRLALSPDLRTQKRGVAILAELAGKLVERARIHFREERFAEAFLDLDRADACARQATPGKLDEIAELRQHVQTVRQEALRMDDSRRRRLTAARQRVDGGSLDAGQALLAATPSDDAQADEIQRDIQRRRAEAAQAAGEAERLFQAGQVAPALEQLRRARAADARSEAVMRLESIVCARVLDDARAALIAGRVVRVSEALATLGDLARATPLGRDLEQILETARAAGTCLRQHKLDDARQQALRLQHLLPDAGWVSVCVSQLKQSADLLAELTAGPLGALGAAPAPTRPERLAELEETRRVAARPLGADEPRAAVTNGLAERLLMLVDGGGSFLLLRGARVTVGRAAADQPADIAITSDLAERHAEIARLDEDYFLLSGREVTVAGRNTRHQLLRDGDRVVLGRQAKFTFRLPSRKSASAVLDLSDTTRMPADIRRVVLLQGHATVGAGSAAHIACHQADRAYVLFERAGMLWIRPQGFGPVQTEARPIEIGKTIEIGDLSFVIQPWFNRSIPARLA
jgi:tetratricopeptide (TPR) repeat protein